MKLTGLTWWIDRWRTSAAYRELTLEEQGAYRNLLDEAWLNGGPLPDDDRLLAKACGCSVYRWRKVRRKVLQKFSKTDDGRWRNSVLDLVFSQSSERQESLSLRGKRAAAARWGGNVGNAQAHAQAMPSGTGTVFIPPTPLKRGARCPHDPKCPTKAECTIRKRRAAGL